MVREQAGRKLPIQHVSYQQPRGCKNCKSGFICPTQPAFTRRPWRGNASPVLPCTCAAVYLLQFQQPLSSFVQTHWMGNFLPRLLPHTVTMIYNKKADCIFERSAQFYSLFYINLSNTQPAQPKLLTPWYMPWLLSHLIHRLYKAILCFSSILFYIFRVFYFTFFE